MAANPGNKWRIGYFNGNTDAVGGAASNQILIKPLLAGDANGDGTVDITDYGIIYTNYLSTTANWAHGDFDYDNVCEFDDLLVWSQQNGFTRTTYPLWV
ncbi:MAG: hypothetical protein QM770_01185 [Tepidisphaeraceae bacterium]